MESCQRSDKVTAATAPFCSTLLSSHRENLSADARSISYEQDEDCRYGALSEKHPGARETVDKTKKLSKGPSLLLQE